MEKTNVIYFNDEIDIIKSEKLERINWNNCKDKYKFALKIAIAYNEYKLKCSEVKP